MAHAGPWAGFWLWNPLTPSCGGSDVGPSLADMIHIDSPAMVVFSVPPCSLSLLILLLNGFFGDVGVTHSSGSVAQAQSWVPFVETKRPLLSTVRFVIDLS